LVTRWLVDWFDLAWFNGLFVYLFDGWLILDEKDRTNKRKGKWRQFYKGEILIYLSSYLDQKTAKRPFRFSSHAATCYNQSNHSKVEAIPLSDLPKDTTSELTDHLHTNTFKC